MERILGISEISEDDNYIGFELNLHPYIWNITDNLQRILFLELTVNKIRIL